MVPKTATQTVEMRGKRLYFGLIGPRSKGTAKITFTYETP